MSTVTGLLALVEVNSSGIRNSPQTESMTIALSAAMPERICGNTTCQNACQRVQPSMRAASSGSVGSSLTWLHTSHIASGVVVLTNTNTNPSVRSMRCMSAMSPNNAMTTVNTGTTVVATIAQNSAPRPGKRSRANA